VSRAGAAASRPDVARWTWVDLRLGPAAVASWGTALVAPRLPAAVLLTGAVVAAMLAAIVTRRQGAAAMVLLGILAGLALGATAAAVRILVRDTSPLREVAAEGRIVEVDLELDDLPRRVAGAGPSRIVADASVRMLRTDGDVIHLHDDVLLFAPEEGWAEVAPGQPVRVRAAASLPDDGHLVAVLSARGPPEPVGPPGWAQRAAQALREGLAHSSSRVLGAGPGGLLPGLVVGDTRGMDAVLTDDFRRAGLSHLTAVSGPDVARCVSERFHPGLRLIPLLVLKPFKAGGYRKGPKSSPVLARKPASSRGRYCIRLSRVFTSAVSSVMVCLVRLASDRFRCAHTGSTGLSSWAYGGSR
jgi:competence protein ComEC